MKLTALLPNCLAHLVKIFFQVMLMVALNLAAALSAHAGLVFSALTEGYWRIYYQDDLTGEPRAVAPTVDGDQSAPALAPDGKQVAFEIQGKGIYVCPLDSATECRLIRPATGYAVRPAWNPRSNDQLLFARYLATATGEDAEIFRARLPSGTSTPLITQTGILDYPSVSPDGRQVVYTAAYTIALHQSGVQVVQQLWSMDLQTGLARQLMPGNAQDMQSRWSPSGKELAFASNRSGQFEIWMVQSDGTGLRQLTSGPGIKTWPVWSPDGNSVLFNLARDGHQQLWIITVDGTQLHPFRPVVVGAAGELRDADWR